MTAAQPLRYGGHEWQGFIPLQTGWYHGKKAFVPVMGWRLFIFFILTQNTNIAALG